MPGETKHGIECSQFEALLSEAIDGKLSGSPRERENESFEAHTRVCAICGPLLADAVEGQQWLKSLEEVEPPPHLMNSILAATSGISSARLHAATPADPGCGGIRLSRQPLPSCVSPAS